MKYIATRSLHALFVLFLIITITFFMIRMAPGGPFSRDRSYSPEVENALNKKYHLDKPITTQFLLYLGGLLKGDFGPSLKQKDHSVNEIIARHFPVSFILGMISILIALFTGVLAGIVSALFKRSVWDYSVMGVAIIGISLPPFVFGPVLQFLFTRYLKWFPVEGFSSFSHIVLPSITLALPFSARFARLMRSAMLDVLSEDYIRTARSKGMSERIVITRHAIKGAFHPVVSFLGPSIAAITTGSLVVEKIFGIPGLGREFVESALNRDYMLVMGTVIVYGAMIVCCNLLSDLFQAFLDPRVNLT